MDEWQVVAAYLIDTHVLIWIDSSPENLSPRATAIIENPSNDIWISTVSLWEMQIKRQLGNMAFISQDPFAKNCPIDVIW